MNITCNKISVSLFVRLLWDTDVTTVLDLRQVVKQSMVASKKTLLHQEDGVKAHFKYIHHSSEKIENW